MTSPAADWIADVTLRILGRRGAILCFHGVTTPQSPAASNMHVSRDELVETLGVLRDRWRMVPLIDLIRRHHDGRSTKGLLAVTFDDAYASVLEVGSTLATLGVPATLFPIGEAIGIGTRFWWDRVDDVFPHVSRYRWREFEEACGVPEEYRRGQPESFGPLRPFRQWMLAHYHGRWPERLTPYLTALEQEIGHSTVQRSMTWAEIEQLTRQAEVHVGVHTLSHPALPFLPDAEVQREITGGLAMVSERSKIPVPILAAPYGLADARVVRLAQATGMLATLSLSGTALGNGRGAGSMEWVPRICMAARAPAWRLKLRLAGLRDHPWQRAGAFPVLPSAST